MNGLLPPLVAVIDVALVKLAVLLLIFAIAGVAKLVSSVRQGQPPARRPPPRPSPPIQDEIEEFLRRASRGEAQGHPAGGATVRRPPQPAAPVRAQVVDETADAPVGAEVVQHVEKYLDTGDFARRSQQLGSEVVQSDAEMTQRVGQTFTHDVGRLAKRQGEAAAPPLTDDIVGVPLVSPLPGLLAMLGEPQGVCQALIANEIMQRPEERWE